jgi:hypothetical protein
MCEGKDYDKAVAYEPLPIYVYPEGDERVASAFGYDLVQRESGCKIATERLFEALTRLNWISEKQGYVMHKLNNERELQKIWPKERKTGERERRAIEESSRR